MKTEYNKAFLDTNVLIYYDVPGLGFYDTAAEIFDLLKEEKIKTFISPQILYEYYSIVTNPKRLSSPLKKDQAIENMKNYTLWCQVLYNPVNIDDLLTGIDQYAVKGRQVFDLKIYLEPVPKRLILRACS